MPRQCKVCRHEKLEEIDRRLVAGETLRNLSASYGMSEASLSRHRSQHLPLTLVKAAEAQEVSRAGNLLTQVYDLHERVLAIFEKNEARGRDTIALQAAREIRNCVELSAKLVGQLQEQPIVNITMNVEWLNLQSLILQALDKHPEAKEAVLIHINEVKAIADGQP